MKKSFLILLLLGFSVAHADEINFQKDCHAGGSRTVTGDYNPDTGEFDLTTELSDCKIRKHRGSTRNGTVHSTGTLIDNSDGSATLNAEVISEITIQRGDHSATFNCAKMVSGNYNWETSITDGTVNSTCERTGEFYSPILKLLTNDEEDDDQDDDND